MLEKTNISRNKLKAKLEENLNDHKELYAEALRVWKDDYQKYVKEFASKVKGGDFKQSFYPPTKPTSYAKEYEQVIAQLDMSSDENIELNRNEFRQYVLDEWSFNPSFYTSFVTASSYQLSPSAMNKLVSNTAYMNE